MFSPGPGTAGVRRERWQQVWISRTLLVRSGGSISRVVTFLCRAVLSSAGICRLARYQIGQVSPGSSRVTPRGEAGTAGAKSRVNMGFDGGAGWRGTLVAVLLYGTSVLESGTYELQSAYGCIYNSHTVQRIVTSLCKR